MKATFEEADMLSEFTEGFEEPDSDYSMPDVGVTGRFVCTYSGYSMLMDMPAFWLGAHEMAVESERGEGSDTADTYEAETSQTEFISDSLSGITYEIPEAWARVDGKSPLELYYYPNYDYTALVYLSIQQTGTYDSFSDQETRDDYIRGIASGIEAYQSVATESIQVSSMPGLHHACKGIISEHELQMDYYAFSMNGFVICFVCGIQEEAPSDNKDVFSMICRHMVDSMNVEDFGETSDLTPLTPTPDPTESPEPTAEPEPTDTSAPTPSAGESSALRKAKEYLSLMPFSYSSLIEQLEFEGYSHSESVYAAENCNADWCEQAAKKAEQYLDLMAFSRNSLIEQLEFEGFTHDQAVYGAEQNGY